MRGGGVETCLAGASGSPRRAPGGEPGLRPWCPVRDYEGSVKLNRRSSVPWPVSLGFRFFCFRHGDEKSRSLIKRPRPPRPKVAMPRYPWSRGHPATSMFPRQSCLPGNCHYCCCLLHPDESLTSSRPNSSRPPLALVSFFPSGENLEADPLACCVLAYARAISNSILHRIARAPRLISAPPHHVHQLPRACARRAAEGD